VAAIEPSDFITKIKPSGSLVSTSVILSVICQMLILTCFQIGIYFYIIELSWYHYIIPNPNNNNYEDFDPDDNIQSQPTTIIFIFSNFQYIIIVIAYMVGKPFRKSIFTNRMFFLLFFLLFFNYL
jgi:cation-transporting ATPase 13A2